MRPAISMRSCGSWSQQATTRSSSAMPSRHLRKSSRSRTSSAGYASGAERQDPGDAFSVVAQVSALVSDVEAVPRPFAGERFAPGATAAGSSVVAPSLGCGARENPGGLAAPVGVHLAPVHADPVDGRWQRKHRDIRIRRRQYLGYLRQKRLGAEGTGVRPACRIARGGHLALPMPPWVGSGRRAAPGGDYRRPGQIAGQGDLLLVTNLPGRADRGGSHRSSGGRPG